METEVRLGGAWGPPPHPTSASIFFRPGENRGSEESSTLDRPPAQDCFYQPKATNRGCGPPGLWWGTRQ